MLYYVQCKVLLCNISHWPNVYFVNNIELFWDPVRSIYGRAINRLQIIPVVLMSDTKTEWNEAIQINCAVQLDKQAEHFHIS